MNERSEMIEWIRGELVGPSRPLAEPAVIEFIDREFVDPVPDAADGPARVASCPGRRSAGSAVLRS